MRTAASSPGKKMRLLPLIAATYFMVSGGPYGIEDIFGGAGFGWAIAILLILPFVWSLPTALMIGELASAIPAEGGFYIWVRRALGPFWGYQESWLSLSASIFDMALYPSIFVLYLGKFSPAYRRPQRLDALSPSLLICTLWNLRGAPPSATAQSRFSFSCSRPSASSSPSASGMDSPSSRLHGALRSHHRLRPRLGLLHRHSRRHVELHGLGQRLHRRAGSRKSPAQLSPRHDRGRRPHRRHLYCPVAAMALAGLSTDSFATGDWAKPLALSVAPAFWENSSPPRSSLAAASPASACSTHCR